MKSGGNFAVISQINQFQRQRGLSTRPKITETRMLDQAIAFHPAGDPLTRLIDAFWSLLSVPSALRNLPRSQKSAILITNIGINSVPIKCRDRQAAVSTRHNNGKKLNDQTNLDLCKMVLFNDLNDAFFPWRTGGR
jgi:hypothetical protein